MITGSSIPYLKKKAEIRICTDANYLYVK